jgi:hypothetical protein
MLTVKQKREMIESVQTELADQLHSLRENCSHEDLTYKYGGSSGNWDKSDNSYWIDWKCGDCGKTWTTSQDNSYHLTTVEYPHAKRIQ